jgi:hypothetical protein
LTYNNTFVAEAAINNFSNGHFRNNLFIGPSDDRPALSATTYTDYSTFDYNGYRKKGNGAGYRLRYPPHDSLNHADDRELTFMEFSSLKELSGKTGFELHGVELSDQVFENVTLPDPARRGHIYPVKGYDFRLKRSSKAVDAGLHLPNITDGYSGKAPDLGAIEGGKVPYYGPRPKN